MLIADVTGQQVAFFEVLEYNTINRYLQYDSSK